VVKQLYRFTTSGAIAFELERMLFSLWVWVAFRVGLWGLGVVALRGLPRL